MTQYPDTFAADQDISSGKFEDDLAHDIIGAAIEVHKLLGPGLLEVVYASALVHELGLREMKSENQVQIPISYKGLSLSQPLQLDLLVEDTIVVAVKSVDALLSVHSAQVITYLRLANKPTGLLINFNAPSLKGSIKRLFQRSTSLHS